MIYTTFFEHAQKNSLLGFGAMRFPTLPEGGIDEPAAIQMVQRALASGVNYFDTAYGYHDGQSEGLLCKALAGHARDTYLLADKLPMWLVKEPEDMERLFCEQLTRCGVDYFDFYLAHALGKVSVETLKRVGTVEFLKRKQAEGKIRHIGFSFHDDEDCFRDVLSLHDWDFCQLQLNYADWNRIGAGKLYQIAEEHHLPVIVMEPVRGGFLANPPAAAATLLHTADPNRSYASWALRFVASQPNVKLILSGMSTQEQVDDNLRTFADSGVYLSPEEQSLIGRVMEQLDDLQTVPCTACRYCMPCPSGVEIPSIFSIYNNAKFYNGSGDSYTETLQPESRADRCISCGACVTACPQHIAIPDRLSEAHAWLTAKKE